MHLQAYFDRTQGIGVLSTADQNGKVNAAIFVPPQVMADGTVAFIMRDRLTHHNLQQNPHALYLFMEHGGGYRGLRLVLTKVKENTDVVLMENMTRRWLSPEADAAKGPKFLVYFRVEETRNLIGSGSPDLA